MAGRFARCLQKEGKYRVNHKFGNALFLLIASQLMKIEKHFLAKMPIMSKLLTVCSPR